MVTKKAPSRWKTEKGQSLGAFFDEVRNVHRLKIVVRLGQLWATPDIPTARLTHRRVPQTVQGLYRLVYISRDTQLRSFPGWAVISPVSLANFALPLFHCLIHNPISRISFYST